MSSLKTVLPRPNVPELHNGDHLTQAEFHRRYEAMPEGVKAELIGGIVFMPSPLRRPHGIYHPQFSGALWLYQSATPGVELSDHATIILGEHSEPQPDIYLRILPEYGGQSRTSAEEYVVGPPELVVEIAHSSAAVDLHAKREDYRRGGVLEYVVLNIGEQVVNWFDLPAGKSWDPNPEGVFQSRVFPGLWIDAAALLARDSVRVIAVLQEGLRSPHHADFVTRLHSARSGGHPA